MSEDNEIISAAMLRVHRAQEAEISRLMEVARKLRKRSKNLKAKLDKYAETEKIICPPSTTFEEYIMWLESDRDCLLKELRGEK